MSLVFLRPTEVVKENSSEEKTETDATNDAKEQVVKATRARGRLVVVCGAIVIFEEVQFYCILVWVNVKKN